MLHAGTEWCGAGNVSSSSSSSDPPGPLAELDLCCRAHDHCHHRMRAQQVVEDCACDDRFEECLRGLEEERDADTGQRLRCARVAAAVRRFYFHSGKMFCLQECPNYK